MSVGTHMYRSLVSQCSWVFQFVFVFDPESVGSLVCAGVL